MIGDDEPRIHGERLAQRLGFERPRAIRALIKRHRAMLERFGSLPQTVANPDPQGGRPAEEYWLNEQQAAYICTQSKAPLAQDVTVEIIEVFVAWRHGRIVPASPLTAEVIGAVFDQRLVA